MEAQSNSQTNGDIARGLGLVFAVFAGLYAALYFGGHLVLLFDQQLFGKR